MSGWLAFVGGAEWTEGCDFDAELLAHSGSTEVLVLPTAAAFEGAPQAVATAQSWFARLGGSVTPCNVLGRPDASDPAHIAAVLSARFIYLSGGSPLHLRSVLKDTPLWQALGDAYRGGAVLAGASAGAMVLGDPMVDPRGGAYTLGLGLVPGFAVLPHADTWSHDKVHRTLRMASDNVTVLAIAERSAALLAPDGSWHSRGTVTAHQRHREVPLEELATTVGSRE